MVLEDGVFYQASYDGTEVAIIADYPGLLPASHVSNQETAHPKEFSHSASPTAPSCAQKGGVRRAMLPRGISQESGPHAGQAFEEEGKQRYSRAVTEEVWICKYVFKQSHPIVTSMFVLYQEKSVPDYVRGSDRSYSPQPGSRSCRKDGG